MLAKWFGTNVCLLRGLLETLFLNSLVGKDKQMNVKKNLKNQPWHCRTLILTHKRQRYDQPDAKPIIIHHIDRWQNTKLLSSDA